MEWVLVLVFLGSITTAPGTYLKEEDCHVTGKEWVKANKTMKGRVNYACLPSNFVNVK